MNSESYKNDRLKKEDKIEFSLNHSCVLAKNTIIDCKGFSVKLKYVKKNNFIIYFISRNEN
jgi:hypothetical protein